MARSVFVRSILAVRRDRRVDETRVDLAQCLVIQPKLLRQPRCEVLNEDISIDDMNDDYQRFIVIQDSISNFYQDENNIPIEQEPKITKRLVKKRVPSVSKEIQIGTLGQKKQGE